MISSMKEAEELSQQYNVPSIDIILIGLNLLGVKSEKSGEWTRCRFRMRLLTYDWPFFFAVTIDSNSPYYHDGQYIWLGKKVIATASPIENDTCNDTYMRKSGRALTLNSNRRSVCYGCEFCGTYSLEPTDKNNLTIPSAMKQKAEDLLCSGMVEDFSKLESIGIVTGCFHNEQRLLEHLLMVRDVFGEFGFKGEIRYIGSQLTTQASLDTLAAENNDGFALYLTVECFERRTSLMRPKKSSVTLEKGRRILKWAKERGMETSLLYILGLDSLEAINKEFPNYVELLTRHPLINVFQIYIPGHLRLRDIEAHKMDYYLKARAILEKIFSKGEWPQGYDNYRSLWFTSYNQKPLRTLI